MENSMWDCEKLELPDDLAISVRCIYPEELKLGSQRDVGIPIFFSAEFTTSKMRIQLKCPPTDEFINRK
jgi:hypothetical protein